MAKCGQMQHTGLSSLPHQTGDSRPMIWSPLLHTCIYPLILSHSVEDELSNPPKNTNLTNSFSCWAMEFQSWANIYSKYKQFSQVLIEIFSMYPFLKRNFISRSFDANLENVQFFALSLLFFLKGWQHCSTYCYL